MGIFKTVEGELRNYHDKLLKVSMPRFGNMMESDEKYVKRTSGGRDVDLKLSLCGT